MFLPPFITQIDPLALQYQSPEAWVKDKDWTKEKKDKYLKNIARQLSSNRLSDYKGSFKIMVKNGEAYHASNPHLDSSRPRNLFNPSTNFCGLLTYLQSYIINDLK